VSETKADPAKAAEIYQRICDPQTPATANDIGYVGCEALERVQR
jgi:hypothetical protein